MSTPTPAAGSISWMDLMVADAEKRRFYEAVAGWTATPVDMGGYSDHCMNAADGQNAAGICHARGENAGLPAQWLIYINIADLDIAVANCHREGGRIVAPVRNMEGGRMAVIQDPAGAVAALFEAGK